MAKPFDVDGFLRKRATASTTTVKLPSGHSVRLQGTPAAVTDAALAKLAAEQSDEKDIRVNAPKGKTAADKRASRAFWVDGQTLAEMFDGQTKAALAKNDTPPAAAGAPAPSGNGAKVTA